MTKEQRMAELVVYRESRKEEFGAFLRDPSFQTVMHKFISFLTDGEGDKIKLNITSGSDSYTDGKSITLGIPDYFFDPSYSRLDWISVFKALLSHEVQHINSSSFTDIKAIRKEYAKYMACRGLSEQLLHKIAQNMLNIMEDSRIENIIVHKYPGFVLPFILLNGEIRLYAGPDKAADDPGQEFTDFVNNCLSYAKSGRLAPNIEVYAGTRFEAEFNKVKPLFDQAVDARTAKDCKKICMKMLRSTADYFADLLSSAAAQEKAGGQGGGNGGQDCEYTTSDEKEYNDSPNGSGSSSASDSPAKQKKGKDKEDKDKDGKDGKDPADGKNDNKKDGAKGDGKDGDKGSDEGENGKGNKSSGSSRDTTGKNKIRDHSDEQSSDDWTDNFSGNGVEDYTLTDLSAEELAALRRGVSDELEKSEKKEACPSKEEKAIAAIQEKYAGEYARVFKQSFPKVSDTALPADLEHSGRKLESAFERVLRIKRSEKRNMRVGVISTRDLYRVGMRDPHVFMRKGQPMNADLAVFLLLDNSGSMGSTGAVMDVNGTPTTFRKSELSRTAASIIERGLSKFAAIKVSLFDVSGGVIRHATLKKFDEKTNGGRCFNSIQSVGVGCGNKDGYSIRVATSDLLARREAKKVLIVLSDGLPSDYNGGTQVAMDDVKEAVREARRKGVIVIPIMFGSAAERKRLKENFAYMYGSFISSDPVDIENKFKKLFIKLVQNS